MKKFLIAGISLFSIFSMASCNQTNGSVSQSFGSSNLNPSQIIGPSNVSPTPAPTTVIPSTTSSVPMQTTPTQTVETKPTTLYLVGDSTVCDYKKADGTITDASYFYDRFGYGTQLDNYLDDKVTIKNLALSGRSSKSFIGEANYNTLKSSIKSGDYLVIGFGHNDEKSDDADRFASANKATDLKGSFKYNLYEYYVKLALDKGATPIICSPIVRYSSSADYSSSNGHITSNGDYSLACKDLCDEKDVDFVNLTSLTKNLYTELKEEAIYFHAMTSGLDSDTADINTADTTHLNIYGAKMVSYLFAQSIMNSSCTLKSYLKDEYSMPTKEKDLIKNSLYTYVSYSSPSVLQNKWFGTVFGDCGGSTTSAASGYVAKEQSGKFIVGQASANGSDSGYKGKISGTTEGRAYMLQKISISKDVVIEADARVNVLNAGIGNGAGFGLLIRDEAYFSSESLNNKSYGLGNSFNAGLLTNSSGVVCNFSRETKKLVSSTDVAPMYCVGSTAHFKIERVGQKITCTVTYCDKVYTQTYIDKDLVAIDHEFYYIGMFAARGTIAEFSNVSVTITGESQGA